MRKLIVALVIGTFVGTTTAAAQGPITASAIVETQRLAASTAQSGSVTRRSNPGLMWAGVGLWAGGVTLEILSWSALKKEESACIFGGGGSFLCVTETHTNWPIMGIGLGMAGGGAAMWLIGGRKVQVAPSIQPRGLALTGRVGL